MKILEKLKVIGIKLYFYLRCLPARFLRFLMFPRRFPFQIKEIGFWVIEWALLLLDLLGFPELFEIFHELINWKIRSLTSEEKKLTKHYFGTSIHPDRIRLNNADFIFSKNMKIAFVSFYTINYFETISKPTFIHELVHIWQFERVGSPYIIRSLRAQKSEDGYNYGGFQQVYHQYLEKADLFSFNYEQMAEIIKDAYVSDGNRQQDGQQKEVYSYFVETLKKT